jgi:hypothetical protein
MVEEGTVAESSPAVEDAERIGMVSWETTAECEVFMIDLVTAEGAPSTAPPALTAQLLREIGLLRVNLDVTGTAVTDQLVQSNLVDRYYVVRSIEPPFNLFVDFILTAPARARVSTQAGPGQVVIELEAGGSSYPASPIATQRTILLSPSPGPVEVPIPILGYGRPFEATVFIQVIQNGEPVTNTFTMAADYIDTWGEFAIDLETEATGPAQLFVGGESAESGDPDGALIDIILP